MTYVEYINLDLDNPSREKLVVVADGVNCLSEMNPLIEEKEKDAWEFESDVLVSNVAYAIFSRPIKTEVDWYARMIDHYPEIVFARA